MPVESRLAYYTVIICHPGIHSALLQQLQHFPLATGRQHNRRLTPRYRVRCMAVGGGGAGVRGRGDWRLAVDASAWNALSLRHAAPSLVISFAMQAASVRWIRCMPLLIDPKLCENANREPRRPSRKSTSKGTNCDGDREAHRFDNNTYDYST